MIYIIYRLVGVPLQGQHIYVMNVCHGVLIIESCKEHYYVYDTVQSISKKEGVKDLGGTTVWHSGTHMVQYIS